MNIRGPCNTLLGYGAVTFNILKAMVESGVSIAFWPIGQPQITTNDHELVRNTIQNQSDYDDTAPSFLVWHEFNLAERIGRGKHTALTFFEVNELDQRRQHHMKSVDLLFVASNWAKDICEKYGISATVLPMGVNRSIFFEDHTKRLDDKVIFLNIAKIEYRKGHDFLIRAFDAAFSESDNVELWMCWNNPFLSSEETKSWERLYKSAKLGDKVKFVGPFASDYELASCIQQADCGIFPTRAEGFGLPILQCMSCGLDIITTDYSAQTEFSSEENSYLIHIDKFEPCYDAKWFFGNGTWAELGSDQLEQCVEYMRGIAVRKGLTLNAAGIQTAKNFSWSNTAKEIKRCLDSI